MRRVLILGSGGAGKSTLARTLGTILQLEVIHLDAYYWQSGWIERPKDQWLKIVSQLIQKESWIMDGNYRSTIRMRAEAADNLLSLDTSRTICLWRILKQWRHYQGTTRPDVANNCPKRLNWEFFQYMWNYLKNFVPTFCKFSIVCP